MMRQALRALARQPATTTVVVLTMAVAIAATTVVYSAIDLVWRFIPVADRSDLVYVASTESRSIQGRGTTENVVVRGRVSMPDLADWLDRSSTFEQFAALELTSVNMTGVDVPMRVSAVRVTANLLRQWGWNAVAGRAFNTDDGAAGAAPVAILTFTFWQRQFSSDVNAIGTSVRLDGIAHTIVGVLPAEVNTGLLKDSDVFLPLGVDGLRGDRRQRSLLVTGRLKPGVTLAQAAGELDAIAGQLRSEHPDANQGVGAAVLPLIEASGFNVRILVAILALIGLLVLVVACANVSGMLVAQLVERRHEFAVRSALGASRFDRVRQLMLESAMASAVACGVGLLLANLGIVALRWLGGDSFGLAAVTMNRRVLAAGLITALLAPFLFALLPALRSSPDPNELKESRGGTAPGSRRARALIVALQAGAAVILMTQIGMLVRTTWTLSDIAPGFDPAHVLTFRVGLSGPQYDKPEAIARFTTAMLARLRGLPGVAFAGITDRLPVADGEVMARLSVEGRGPVPLEAQPAIARAAIEGDYLAAMRIPITWGRVFSAAELSGASPVALVNEEALRRFWPGADLSSGPPRRLALNAAPGGERWLDVVGVVGNLRNSDVDQGPLPEVFIPAAQQPSREMAVVVKTGGPSPLDLVPAIRAEVARLDPDQPVHDVALMTQVLYDDLAGTYVLAALLSAVGLVALGLSAAGVYGLVSYSVAQRGREIGVRMALGARPAVVVRMIVASAARPVAMGGVAGLMAATALALGADVSVPGTEARDPLNYLTVATAIVTVGLLASYLPARRAARIEPVTVLRQ